MCKTAAMFADGGPVLETAGGFSGRVLARYDDNGSPLLQGYLIGEKHLASKAAALDVAVDAGTSRCCDFDPSGTASRSALRARFNAVLNVVEH